MKWLVKRSADVAGGGSGAKITGAEAAAGLLILAARADGAYTEVERDRVTKGLMKLFQLANPAAGKIRQVAEKFLARDVTLAQLAEVARSLDADVREKLLTRVWDLLDRNEGEVADPSLAFRISDAWTMSRERAKALRMLSSAEGAA